MHVCGPIPEPARVELRVCSPHQPVRLISARRSGQVGSLQCLWPSAPKRFIFNGLELREGQTFGSYGIRDGDLIIAVPQGDDGVHRWMALTRDHESINEALRWVLDPKTAGEAARLRDLQLWRLEQRPRLFAKLCLPFNGDGAEGGRAVDTTVLADAPAQPCCEKLPVGWEEPRAE
jgi:hypothetical protein